MNASQSVVGSPLRWSQDIAIVGGVTGFLSPLFVIANPSFSLVSGVVGAVVGGVLGVVMAGALNRFRHALPLTVWWLIAVFVGAAWGATSGAFGGMFAGSSFGAEAIGLGMLCGGASGALQLGWMFLPYVIASTTGTGRVPVILTAACLAPLLGWAGIITMFSGLWLVAAPFLFLAAFLIEQSVSDSRKNRTRSHHGLARSSAHSVHQPAARSETAYPVGDEARTLHRHHGASGQRVSAR